LTVVDNSNILQFDNGVLYNAYESLETAGDSEIVTASYLLLLASTRNYHG